MMPSIDKLLCSALLLVCTLNCEAASWIKLKDNAYSRLMLDKQSVITQDAYKKAWVKVEYKTPQKNPDSVDKEYTLSKALWYFDCKVQTTATTQVFQYIHQELVYSAAVDLKSAEFIEPQPDSDVEIAMRFVCKSSGNQATVSTASHVAPPSTAPKQDAKSEAIANVAPPAAGNTAKPAPETKPVPDAEAAPAKKAEKSVVSEKTSASKVAPAKAGDWSYAGKTGPEQWGKLDAQFNTCSSGLNQSPAPLDSTIHAALKPIRTIHKFAAKDIQRLPHGLRVYFKEGNMMVLDKSAFQLKYIDIHTPSEHHINGQQYPLELQFFHEDNKKNMAVMSVLFKSGDASEAMEKLLTQLPKAAGETVPLKARLVPSDWMPTNPQYYRYGGSLTTPPCTEGVRWIVMKSPRQASAEQIKALTDAIGTPNQRPQQALNGRTVLE